MAVATTGAAGCQDRASAASHTFAYTVAADADCLIVTVVLSAAPLPTISVTYAGASMAQAVSADDASAVQRVAIFRKVAPATGANNVVVTLGAAAAIGSTQRGLKGVDQTTPISNTNSATGVGGTPSVAVTSAAGEWTISEGESGAVFATPNQTQICNAATNVNEASEEATGAASVTHSWAAQPGSEWVMVIVSAKAAAAAAAAPYSTRPTGQGIARGIFRQGGGL